MKGIILFTLGLLLVSAQFSEMDDITSFGFEGETENIEACWLASYGRGVGTPISVCPEGLEDDAALCYEECDDGFTGVGPVCWEDCPPNFEDTGVDCLKPPAYGRGAGYVAWEQAQCEEDNPSVGCSEYGLIWYPNCEEGFYNAGCCICSPDCPSGMVDIGVSCQKESYGRGVGTPLTCPSNQEYDAGLCYNPCEEGFSGVGPVCWGSCPEGWSQCGALCLTNGNDCTAKVLSIVGGVMSMVVDVASAADDPVGAAVGVAGVVEDLDYPICSSQA